jgi:hypothetical protein
VGDCARTKLTLPKVMTAAMSRGERRIISGHYESSEKLKEEFPKEDFVGSSEFLSSHVKLRHVASKEIPNLMSSSPDSVTAR